ncbi:MAG: DUF418 domain-containing protein [Novosphingobium sp.]
MSDPLPAPAERLITLDFMRGVAVLGILLMNIVAFAWPEAAAFSPRVPFGPQGRGDEAVFLVEFVLVEGKFRGLFSLLFGASMVLLVERTDAAGEDGPALQRRRLGWLAAFGLAHYFLLWWGDILFLYAVCGLFALAFIDWPARRLVALALPLYAVGVVWLGALTASGAAPWLGGAGSPEQAAATTARRFAREAAVESRAYLASWPDKVTYQVAHHWDGPLLAVATTALETLPLMLLGMALLRCGLLRGEWPPRRTFTCACGGIAVGLAMTVPLALWLRNTGYPLPLAIFVGAAAAAPGRLALTLGYAALLVLLARALAGSAGGERITAAGRMAFSNYLGTSLLMAGLFQGWGFGLYGRLSRVELLGVVACGWVVMLVWSRPWLARYRQGPLEAVWRRLTR